MKKRSFQAQIQIGNSDVAFSTLYGNPVSFERGRLGVGLASNTGDDRIRSVNLSYATKQDAQNPNYKLMPIVSNVYSGQLPLVKAVDNPQLRADARVKSVFVDGQECFVLTDGTYNNVYMGYDANGRLLLADTVQVGANKASSEDGSSTGSDNASDNASDSTRITWYVPLGTSNASGDIKFNVYQRMDKVGETVKPGETSGSFRALSFMGDHSSMRLYDEQYDPVPMLNLDKSIVLNNGDDNNVENDELSKYSLIQEGNAITYRIQLENVSASPVTIAGSGLWDALPKTTGGFTWDESHISNMRCLVGDGSSFENIDAYALQDTSPKDGTTTLGQRYLVWQKGDKQLGITIQPKQSAYIYLTLTYPSGAEYEGLTALKRVHNTAYYADLKSSVTHNLDKESEAALVKLVDNNFKMRQVDKYTWESMEKMMVGTTSEYLPSVGDANPYKSVTRFSVVLANTGDTNLYFNSVQDVLPKGFKFWYWAPDNPKRLDRFDSWRHYFGHEFLPRVAVRNKNGSPLTFVNFLKGQAENMSVEAGKYTDSGQELVEFKFLNKKTNNYSTAGDIRDLRYDDELELNYLAPNEYIVISYYALAGTVEETKEIAQNNASMQFNPIISSKLKLSEVDITRANRHYQHPWMTSKPANVGPYNMITDAQAQGQGMLEAKDSRYRSNIWLNSYTLQTRAPLVPSISKKAIQGYDPQQGAYAHYPNYPNPKMQVTWRIDASNDGVTPIEDYVITDVLDFPYGLVDNKSLSFTMLFNKSEDPKDSTNSNSILNSVVELYGPQGAESSRWKVLSNRVNGGPIGSISNISRIDGKIKSFDIVGGSERIHTVRFRENNGQDVEKIFLGVPKKQTIRTDGSVTKFYAWPTYAQDALKEYLVGLNGDFSKLDPDVVYKPFEIEMSARYDEHDRLVLSTRFKGSAFALLGNGGTMSMSYITGNSTNTLQTKTYYNNAYLTPLNQTFNPRSVQTGVNGSIDLSEFGSEFRNKPSVFNRDFITTVIDLTAVSNKQISGSYTEINNATGTPTETNVNVSAWATDIKPYIDLPYPMGTFTYTNVVDNSNKNESDAVYALSIVDSLPQIGDHDVLSLEAKRGSAFRVNFAADPRVRIYLIAKNESGVTEKVLIDPTLYTVEYSEKTEFSTNTTDPAHNDFEPGGNASDWHSEVNPERDRSIRVLFNKPPDDKPILKSLAKISLEFDAQAPLKNADGSVNKIEPGKIAWNNFAYQYAIGPAHMVIQGSPRNVGLRSAYVPVLTKKLVNNEMSALHALADHEFNFLVVPGSLESLGLNAQASDGDIAQALKAQNKKAFIVTAQVNQGESESKPVDLFALRTASFNEENQAFEQDATDTTESYLTAGGEYTILELGVDAENELSLEQDGRTFAFTLAGVSDSVQKALTNGKKAFTFRYDPQLSLEITAINKMDTWNAKLVKTGEVQGELLPGAIFGLYSHVPTDKMSEEAFNTLKTRLNLNAQYSEIVQIDDAGIDYYLKDVQATNDQGVIVLEGLTEEAYGLKELQAPEDYGALPEMVKLTRVPSADEPRETVEGGQVVVRLVDPFRPVPTGLVFRSAYLWVPALVLAGVGAGVYLCLKKSIRSRM